MGLFFQDAAAGPLRLAWDRPPDVFVAGYHVYRGDKSWGPYQRLTTSPVGGLEYSDETAQLGRSYVYVVSAVDTDGRESPFSAELTVTLAKFDFSPEPGTAVARVSSDLTVRTGEFVLMSGQHREPEDRPVTYRWMQLSGPAVSISGIDRPEAAFLAPNATAELTFGFTVADNMGGSSTDIVRVSVKAR